MSIDQFKAGVSRIRNPVFARVFSELGLAEEWGSGYKRINAACLAGGYPKPYWQELGVVLRVTFYPHSSASQHLSYSAKPNHTDLTVRQAQILKFIEDKQNVMLSEILAFVDDKVAERALQDDLAKIKRLGLFASRGRG